MEWSKRSGEALFCQVSFGLMGRRRGKRGRSSPLWPHRQASPRLISPGFSPTVNALSRGCGTPACTAHTVARQIHPARKNAPSAPRRSPRPTSREATMPQSILLLARRLERQPALPTRRAQARVRERVPFASAVREAAAQPPPPAPLNRAPSSATAMKFLLFSVKGGWAPSTKFMIAKSADPSP